MEAPRNIRQIGDIEDSLRLYIEDYVMTFMGKQKRRGAAALGALLGIQGEMDGVPCVFIRGAVLAEELEQTDGVLQVTPRGFNGIYADIAAYFKGTEICGWFLCSSDPDMTDPYELQKSYGGTAGEKEKILFVYDGTKEEEVLYRLDDQGIHRLPGYYIYYERNEQMQEYMIAREPARSSEFTLLKTDPAKTGVGLRDTDQAARQFRSVMNQRNQKKKKAEKSRLSMVLNTVSLAAILCGAGFGLAAWYRHDGLAQVRHAIAVMAGDNGSRQAAETESSSISETESSRIPETENSRVPETESTGMSSEQEAEQQTKAGGENSSEARQVVIKELPGGIFRTEPAAEQTGETAVPESQSTDEAAEGGNGSNSAAESESAQTDGAGGTEPAAAGSFREYRVQKGDTLSGICKEVYGSGSEAKMKEICEINGLENADFIYEGQKLLLP